MGNDYYVTNEHLGKDDGSLAPSGEVFGYYVITHQYFQRYGLPVMHTETNLQDAEGAPNWLWKEWANVHRLHQDGVPILGRPARDHRPRRQGWEGPRHRAVGLPRLAARRF
jgi:hypothetical protein